MSTGAEAGIGVGVGLAVICLMAYLIYALLRRKHRRTQPLDGGNSHEPVPHAVGVATAGEERKQMFELSGKKDPTEIDGRHATIERAELGVEG